MSISARAATLLTASALTLGLGVGPAAADDTGAATGRAVSTEASSSTFGAGSGVSAAGTISALQLGDGIITQRPLTQFVGTVTGSAPAGTQVQTDVRLNGVPMGRVTLYPGVGNGGVELPRQWGPGQLQVGPSYFADGTVDPAVSNIFYARKQVTTSRRDGYALKINRRNNTMKFRARQVVVVNPGSGRFDSARRVKLQQLKRGKWRTIKNIKLNSRGNGSYSTSIKKKYRYRLYVPRTSSTTQFYTIKTRRI
ncbi:hypothetical protein [Aeromicrobium endophyticum]|nr:hypothetical protein [Aeromicrobium endophyticum]